MSVGAAIVRKVRIERPARAVWEMVSTDAGREAFWCERSRESGGALEMEFPNGVRERFETLGREEGRALRMRYFGGSELAIEVRGDGDACEVTVTETGVAGAERAENESGWVSVLLALKAAAQHGIDLRNHDPARTWDQGYVDN